MLYDVVSEIKQLIVKNLGDCVTCYKGTVCAKVFQCFYQITEHTMHLSSTAKKHDACTYHISLIS